MTEHKLSEQELQEIREEAERLYPPPQNEGEGFERYFQTMTRIRQYQRDTHIAALTRERERVKPVTEAMEKFLRCVKKTCPNTVGLIEPIRMVEHALNNYKNNK